MPMTHANDELKVRRDTILHNSQIAAEEHERLCIEALDIEAAIRVLEAHDRLPIRDSQKSSWGAGSVDD